MCCTYFNDMLTNKRRDLNMCPNANDDAFTMIILQYFTRVKQPTTKETMLKGTYKVNILILSNHGQIL